MVKAIILQCKSYHITVGGNWRKSKNGAILLQYSNILNERNTGVFESESDFGDFYRKEMAVRDEIRR